MRGACGTYEGLPARLPDDVDGVPAYLDNNAPAWAARVRWRRRQGLEGEALVVDLERWAASAYLADVAPYSAQRMRRLLSERRELARELVWAWARGVR